MTDNTQTVWCWVIYEHDNDNSIYQVSRTTYEPDVTTFPSHLTYTEISQSVFDSMENYLQYKYNTDGTVTEINHDINMNGYQRALRNEKLAETDYWAVGDRTMTAEQTAYRQALRDLPTQDGWPDNVTWPTKP